MTPNITPWTPWSRASPVSWSDYTPWTASVDRTEGYAHTHTEKHACCLLSDDESATHDISNVYNIYDVYRFIIASSPRRNLNHRDAKPTRRTVSLGPPAQVRQSRPLCASGFVLICNISAVKSHSVTRQHVKELKPFQALLFITLGFPELAHSHSSPGLDTAVSTKVLYFTDRSLTPFLVNIPKR